MVQGMGEEGRGLHLRLTQPGSFFSDHCTCWILTTSHRVGHSKQRVHGSSPSYRRDGYLMLFQFLPLSFGEQFVSFIDRILPPLLMGLADQSEYVRETALLASVKQSCKSHF